ncbi:hypothetical protein OPV22_000441 [Ensete ventricosum]|uniref:Uncharacterized protein n=1 Tax=Ensete ventricosum TaxID=4639 RepID=A0AAV8RVD5_ENSVE|nr:hypothetical protein OPV22_000441 [Ensete ventricosum]
MPVQEPAIDGGARQEAEDRREEDQWGLKNKNTEQECPATPCPLTKEGRADRPLQRPTRSSMHNLPVKLFFLLNYPCIEREKKKEQETEAGLAAISAEKATNDWTSCGNSLLPSDSSLFVDDTEAHEN